MKDGGYARQHSEPFALYPLPPTRKPIRAGAWHADPVIRQNTGLNRDARPAASASTSTASAPRRHRRRRDHRHEVREPRLSPNKFEHRATPAAGQAAGDARRHLGRRSRRAFPEAERPTEPQSRRYKKLHE